jgi:two-component system, sensor histidine kinase PdtaS
LALSLKNLFNHSSFKKQIQPLLIICCLFSSVPGYEQGVTVDTKKQAWEILNHNIPDSIRHDVYNKLGRIYFIESWINKKIIDSAFYYLRKGAYFADSSNIYNNENTNQSLRLLAQTYIYAGDTLTAKKIFRQVIQIYQHNQQKLKEADTWRLLAKELWVRNVRDPFIPAYYDSAISIFDQLQLPLKKVEMNVEKMYFFSEKGNKSASETEHSKILIEAAKYHRKNYSYIFKILASEERFKGNLNKALNYSLEAVKNLDSAADKKDRQLCYGELAQVYEELGEAEKSIYWYKKCIEERKNKFSQYIIYRTTSLLVGQMIKAKQERQALRLLEQMAIDDPPKGFVVKGILSQSMAYCYVAMKKYTLAEEKFLEMIDAYREGEFNHEILQIAYYDVGKFYVHMQQFEKAKPYLNKALEISGSAGRTRDLNFLLFKVDSANGNLADAIRDFQKFKSLNDSIFNQDRSRQIEELMIKYETEKKDQDIKLLENESKSQKSKLTQANQTRNWIVGVAALFLIIIGLLINNSRLKQQTNKKLQMQQKEIEKKNLSLQHLVKEKDWLVKEIHHRVKNNFHIVMGLLGTQSEYLKTDEAKNSMAESQHRIHAMSLIHQKLYQSDNLSAINMVGYVHELVDYLKDSFNIRHSIRFTMEIDPIELNLAYCVPLGLILNEAITNSIKYAFPVNHDGNIFISLKKLSSNNFQLVIRDNGIGLPDKFNVSNPSSMGLKLIKGLSEDIDGQFEICTKNGTEINLVFNYEPGKTNGQHNNSGSL